MSLLELHLLLGPAGWCLVAICASVAAMVLAVDGQDAPPDDDRWAW